MADTEHSATKPDMGGSDLKVIIRPYKMDFWEYEGSRAQLEAEGVIPSTTEWPEGAENLYWNDSCFQWSLGRTRPEGLKGPMALWTNGDWWNLRCSDLHNRSDARRILEIRRKLADELYRQSPAGRREWDAAHGRYMKAQHDQDFQAFKAMIPGLTPPKRGRKPKAADLGAQP